MIMKIGLIVLSKFSQVKIDELMLRTYKIHHLGEIIEFSLFIERKPIIDDCNP